MALQKQLIEQIKVVINKLEQDYVTDINSGVLHLIHKRYNNALKILESKKDIKGINISGGARAYMDSKSDYQNPLLEELYRAEKMYKELLVKQ